jgi:16S rRNA (guanine527-N7)-methyltransferase
LQLATYVPRGTLAIIDIGSGAGLPGIILATATSLPTYLIESDMKKTVFLEEVCRKLGLNKCKIHGERAEKAKIDVDNKTNILITARAVAEIAEIFDMVVKLKNNNDLNDITLLLPKGKTADIEIEKAKKDWEFDFKKYPSKTDNNASILVINNIRGK